eukprot:6465995-Amphidinium_carterae.1
MNKVLSVLFAVSRMLHPSEHGYLRVEKLLVERNLSTIGNTQNQASSVAGAIFILCWGAGVVSPSSEAFLKQAICSTLNSSAIVPSIKCCLRKGCQNDTS